MGELIINTGAVVLKDSKVLLVQEAEEPFRGKWNFPLGKLEHETILEGVVREVKEETGYEIKLTGFLGVYQNIPADNLNVVIVMFSAEPVSGELKFDPNEHLQARWFQLEEFEKLPDSEVFHPEMKNVVKRALKDKRGLDNYTHF
jgi:ADP-ribose pyrophosphatase YjhB (NUDIX family)